MKYDDYNLISHYDSDVNHVLLNAYKHNDTITHVLLHTNSIIFTAYVHKSRDYIIVEYANQPITRIEFLLIDAYYQVVEVQPLIDIHDGMQTVHDLQVTRRNGLQ